MGKVTINSEIAKIEAMLAKMTPKQLREEMLQIAIRDIEQERQIHELQQRITRDHHSYMARCRSSGGVTLPPGM